MQNSIYRFIDDLIGDMDNTVRYSIQERTGRAWCIAELDDEYQKGFGALLFCKCYEHSITDYEYENLLDKLFNAQQDALQRLAKEY